MPSASPNPIPDSLQSMKDIQWLDPIELDLSLFDDEIGKQRLSNQLAKAVRTNGFFTVKNSGIPKEMIEQQFKLSRGFFELPLEEKLPYHNKEAYTAGDQTGYKPSDVRLKL
jgi:isopenicillin N synthase-like dioxygenase